MSTQQATIAIHGTAPKYDVTLTPAGPYRFSEPNSTLVLTLDRAARAAGFCIAGIGFSGIHHGRSTSAAQDQINASVKSVNGPQDTLEVQDAVTADGRFEFILIYQDAAGTLYGLDPDILNDLD